MRFTALLLCFLTIHCGVEGANILITFPIPVPSHNILGIELAKAIARRGHNVTFITPFASKRKTENVSEIVLEDLVEGIEGETKRCCILAFVLNIPVVLQNEKTM